VPRTITFRNRVDKTAVEYRRHDLAIEQYSSPYYFRVPHCGNENSDEIVRLDSKYVICPECGLGYVHESTKFQKRLAAQENRAALAVFHNRFTIPHTRCLTGA
jgi:hypothetical protein